VPAEIISATLEPPGVYGKLPARGDFITRRFGRPVIEAWNAWLQPAILASRDTLAERWLEIYLTSPIWRFALGAENCGPNTLVGVLLPSVDKVGRYFPLMLGRELAPGIELTGVIAQASPWYRTVEELALAALAPEFRLEAFEDPIALDVDATVMAPEATEPLAPPGLHIPLGGDARSVALRHAHQPLAQGRTLWWTSGSEHVVPCLLICPGMPSSPSFASLLDGDWARGGWLVPAEESTELEEGRPPPSENGAVAPSGEDAVARSADNTHASSSGDPAGETH
jgi:type VI secretion system protein ImpM